MVTVYGLTRNLESSLVRTSINKLGNNLVWLNDNVSATSGLKMVRTRKKSRERQNANLIPR